MFAKATKNFTKQIDPDGCLIPVSRLNNSDKLDMLSLVIKRNPFWFWQRPRYLPTDFTLSDVLLGEAIRPDVAESDFLKYEGMYSDNLAGKIDAGLGRVGLNLEGKGSSKLQSSFGHLKKQEVDVQNLLFASRDRLLNLDHCLVQQTREKRNDVFGVLKERIFTTQPCSITQEVMGQVNFACVTAAQVSVRENGNMEKDSNVSMEIPPHTVIAYSIIELEVKRGGQYELCLQPDTLGGFEADSAEADPLCISPLDVVLVDGPMAAGLRDELLIPGNAPLSILDERNADIPVFSACVNFCVSRCSCCRPPACLSAFSSICAHLISTLFCVSVDTLYYVWPVGSE
uniref:Gasdermin E n=1 Tax=Scleropages formosus TaxID=113540 RepID=A0A8C9WDY3_SCLFO